jgi:hypothetical protein
MASAKTVIVALFCSVVLLSAVTAHAGIYLNGMSINGLAMNGMSANGLAMNGSSANGLAQNELTAGEGTPVEGPRDGLPFILISQMALGKTRP